MDIVFESDDIVFAKVSKDLIDDYLIMINDNEHVNKFIGSLSSSITKEQEEKWIEKKLLNQECVYSMMEKKTNKFIGNIELMDKTDKDAELGIAITYQMQDKGYGTKAIQALINYSFNELKLERIHLRTKPFNLRAIHVYKKIGFKEYNKDSNHLYMEIFK